MALAAQSTSVSGTVICRIFDQVRVETQREKRNECGLFLLFDNFKLPLSTITAFEEADISQSLSLVDIDQATGRLMAAADTIRLLIS